MNVRTLPGITKKKRKKKEIKMKHITGAKEEQTPGAESITPEKNPQIWNHILL